MLTKFYTCDHCGNKLDEMKDYVEAELDKYGLIQADLCADCYKQLHRMVYTFLGKELNDGD